MMLHFHNNSLYIMRGINAWCAQRAELEYLERELDAGYCLDAIARSPAGSTERIEPAAMNREGEPFAAPSETRSRDNMG